MASVATSSAPLRDPLPDSRRPRRRSAFLVGTAVVVVAPAVAGAVAAGGSTAPGPPPSSLGISENRPVPASVLSIPLVNEHGQTTSLGAFRGKVVVLTSFLTSCQETCPLTTGAFLDMQRDLVAAGLAGKVTFIEASVDPGRDSPERLSAYAHLTGAHWPLLTGTAANLAALWHYFGIYYQNVPEGNPPGIDWQTGRPYTYDVNHSDGFLVFNQNMDERFVTGAAPDLAGHKLQGSLQVLLDAQGFKNLFHPGRDSWTIAEGLQAIGWVVGRNIPQLS
jgi:cytochrome oxidase Cu insertion factor (SCO1/SenC/PrrC family)